MGKNNRLINQMNALAQKHQRENVEIATNEMVTQIYAAMALSLHRTCGFGYKRITDVFAESQRIWESFSGKGDDMIKLCEEETGITIQGGDKVE